MATVSVYPPEAWARRGRLFRAIQEALEVRIVPAGERSAEAADAAIVFGKGAPMGGLPTLVLPSDAPEPRSARVEVAFARQTRIDRSLWGASLSHGASRLEELPGAGEHEILAHAGSTPIWAASGNVEHVTVGISELGPSEPLRSRLSSGSFLPLVPIVDFLRRCAPERFAPAPPRAAFLFDDPNLHGTSYGYLDYRRLAADARRLGYHVAFATIPLDAWYTSRSAAELFRSHRDVLSLLVHGNDHVRRELARPLDPNTRRALLAQGLRRIERVESRHGVSVARVMAPPHGACSEAMAAEMPSFGYDALCVSRPYPWLEAPPPDRVLAGWRQTDIVASGLPVVSRLHFSADRGEIVLRAFLRQPIILFGHHRDVRGGLGLLQEATEQVNRVGEVHWASLDEIVAMSYETRVEGGRLYVRLHTRRAIVPAPEGISELVVEWPASLASEQMVVDGKPVDEFPVSIAGGARVEIRVARVGLTESSVGRPAGRRIWPYTRRSLAETRDRLLPLISRA